MWLQLKEAPQIFTLEASEWMDLEKFPHLTMRRREP
jgi:hypothetical protein